MPGHGCPAIGGIPTPDHQVAGKREDAGKDDRNPNQLGVSLLSDTCELLAQNSSERIIGKPIEARA
jgi:hypothetical protein